MLQLENPFIILGVIPIFIIWWVFFRQRVGYRFPNTLIQKHTHIDIRVLFFVIFQWISIFLIFVLLAGPISREVQYHPKYSEKSIILVLDISKSMLADDISPSRIEGAKKVLISLLEHESNNQFGLVIFAGKAFTLSPISHDKEGLINIIKNINTDTIKQHLPGLSGTNIGDALLAAAMLERNDAANSTIVLITDGRANIGADPILATKYIQGRKSPIYTIGIGASSGATLSYLDNTRKRQYFYNEKGEKVEADMDIQILEQIAQLTGGKFFQANSEDMFIEIFDTLRQNITTKPEYTEEIREKSLKTAFYFILIFTISLYSLFAFWIRKI